MGVIGAAWGAYQRAPWLNNPYGTQERTLKTLLRQAGQTQFGQEHGFDAISKHEQLGQTVPLRDYEGLRPWLDNVHAGKANVLWPGKPIYLAKTSGTTSGSKYIPLTRESTPNHIRSALNAALCYFKNTNSHAILEHYLLYLSGSPDLQKKHGIHVGRLSGISNHQVPAWLRTHQLPTLKVNRMDDWEAKVEAMVTESLKKPVSLIGGIPPWIQMYLDRMVARTGQPVGDFFPMLRVLLYGGVNVAPYKQKLFDTIGRVVDTVELYPASEGFFAYQDRVEEAGMLLLLNEGIYYEFVPLAEIDQPNPTRLPLEGVQVGQHYVMVISTNAGLWSYVLGDVVQFVTTAPHRVLVTGRVSHYTSAFGEHVIAQEVDQAIAQTLAQFPGVQVLEFTVAPQLTPAQGLPHHEWWIAFGQAPADMPAFEAALDQAMRRQNVYYDDLVRGSILRPLVVQALPADAFRVYMKTQGKLGEQNKVPRLANHRRIAEALEGLVVG